MPKMTKEFKDYIVCELKKLGLSAKNGIITDIVYKRINDLDQPGIQEKAIFNLQGNKYEAVFDHFRYQHLKIIS